MEICERDRLKSLTENQLCQTLEPVQYLDFDVFLSRFFAIKEATTAHIQLKSARIDGTVERKIHSKYEKRRY